MRIGKLRERVEIQTAIVTRDDYNAERISWPPAGAGLVISAMVKEYGGREPVMADREVMLVSYEVTVRYSGLTAAISHRDRVLWRGKTLSIETVTPVRANGVIILRCLEVQL